MSTVDRRDFLARTLAVSAAAATGATAWTTPGSALAAGPARFGAGAYLRPRPEAMADPTELTIAEAAWMIKNGKLTPAALVEAYLDRIGRFDGVYQAFNTVLAEQARAAAKAAGRRKHTGPLHGIPLAIKDNYWTAGVRTTANSYLFQDFVPPRDATAVTRLTANGAIVLGKTQMGPLATTRATTPDGRITTVNAWTPGDATVDPGGSSTGTATSVAGRMAASGTGTQTGGSITAPSNAQNLTGLKPTMGRVSLAGIIPLSYTRDHPGPLARDARDAAIMLTAMAGEDPADPRTQGLPPVPDLVTAATPVTVKGRVRSRWKTRVGVLPGYVTSTERRVFLSTLDGVDGISLVDVPLPDEWELLTGTEFNNVRLPERSEPFLPLLRTDLRGFGVSVTGWLQGALLGSTEFLTGQRAKQRLLERVLDQIFDRCDVVVQTGPVPFDILGLPEIGFPIGFSAAGVPVGTILGGEPYGEDRLLSVVAAYQAVTDWHWRRPADPPAQRTRTADDRGRLNADEVVAQMQ
ncbi:amidase [Actinoplanes sp. NBRC 101535]|uniref:amidase n=1 Tax=Actinoplanes sp. NBRC 101535 TaxID=3032196 RepID=UPI0024A3C4E6|nr:amidase [Actinoplanes sp. NBRC 101535]GLY04406.1 glutamyl-tRNA(Gln) amidotransferase subunit A [Actinoplanes sp. NBRC 101535]